jgi:hypothetical protein
MTDDENRRDAWVYRRESVSELRELPQVELEQRHDALVEYLAKTDPWVTPVNVRQDVMSRIEAFSTELVRREMERQGKRMEALTRSMNRLTWVGVTVAIVGVVLSLLTLLSGA